MIASGATIVIDHSPIAINRSHNNLYLEIQGALKYDVSQSTNTTPSGNDEVFNLVGCDDVTIDGVNPLTGGRTTRITTLRQ